VARTSLAPISRSSLPLNKLVINTAKFPRKAIPIAGKLADPITLSLISSYAKAILQRDPKQPKKCIMNKCIMCRLPETPISKFNAR